MEARARSRRRKLRKRGEKKVSDVAEWLALVVRRRQWVWAVTGVRGQGPLGQAVVSRQEKRSAHLSSRCPERVDGDARYTCARTRSNKRARTARSWEPRDLQGAYARVSGLRGA